jgi:hypothetical protein
MNGEQEAGKRKSSLGKFQLAGKIALVIGGLGLAEAGL